MIVILKDNTDKKSPEHSEFKLKCEAPISHAISDVWNTHYLSFCFWRSQIIFVAIYPLLQRYAVLWDNTHKLYLISCTTPTVAKIPLRKTKPNQKENSNQNCLSSTAHNQHFPVKWSRNKKHLTFVEKNTKLFVAGNTLCFSATAWTMLFLLSDLLSKSYLVFCWLCVIFLFYIDRKFKVFVSGTIFKCGFVGTLAWGWCMLTATLCCFNTHSSSYCFSLCSGLTLAGLQGAHQATLSQPSSDGREKGYITKGWWVQKRAGRDHSPVTIMGRTHLT